MPLITATPFIATSQIDSVNQLFERVGSAGDEYGERIAAGTDGIYVFVSQDEFNPPGSDAGAVEDLKLTDGSPLTYTLQQDLQPPGIASNDQFGLEVKMNDAGDRAIVASSFDHTPTVDAGSIHYFTRAGDVWTHQQQFVITSQEASQFLGAGIGINTAGDKIVVSAHGRDEGGSNRGAAYVFTESGGTWTEGQKFTQPSPVNSDFFGIGSLSGDGTVFAGRISQTGASGAIWVFNETGSPPLFTSTQKLTAIPETAGDSLGGGGINMDRAGKTIVAGANFGDGGTLRGALYIYEESGGTWSTTRLISPNPQDNEQFALRTSINLDGTRIAASAPGHNGAGTDRGAVYIYEKIGSTWTFSTKLERTGATNGDHWGGFTSFTDSGLYLIASGANSTGGSIPNGTFNVFKET